jgi:DNA-binding transcriptional MerR regulator
MDVVTIGEFARQTRLSPKALRLYDELGLLPPARVDPDSGYRFYQAGQLERARLVASLRQIGVPLAEIKPMLDMAPSEIAARLVELWAEVEADHTARRELVSRLVDRLNGKRSVMYDVATREMPDRSLLCLKRHVDGQQAVWDLGKEFIALMKERPLPKIDGRAGATFLIYHGEVNQDSDGPVEMCRPVPDDQAEELAARFPELTLRTEPRARGGIRSARDCRADRRPVAARVRRDPQLGRRTDATTHSNRRSRTQQPRRPNHLPFSRAAP